MKAVPHVTEAEWEVMKVLWKGSPRLAQDIIGELASTKKWAPSTIKTLLNRLIRKGALRFEKSGKSYHYFPVYTEEESRGAETNSFLKRVFDDSLSPLLVHFARNRKLNNEELATLEAILKEGRGQ